MANYFSNRNNNLSKKATLRAELHNLCKQEQAERFDYIMRVQNLIASRPGLTASQYAMLLSDNACERESIRTSIGVMAYYAEDYRKYGRNAVSQNPAIPNLHRKTKTIKRNFVELDEDGNPIDKFSMMEEKYVYSM